MPNWCHNTLTVCGEPDAVKAFVEHSQVEPQMVHNPEVDWLKDLIEHSRPEQQLLRFKLGRRLANTPAEVEEPGTPLSFAQDVPEPEHVGDDGKGLFPGWYSWRLENWGSKWDASFHGGPMMALGSDDADVGVSIDALGLQQADGVAVYKFDTAWSPPVEWAQRASACHPELSFTLRYGEPGNGVAGEVVFRNGELEHETELMVEDVLAPEEMWF